MGDGAGTSIHAGGGAALALPNPNSTAPTHGETRVVLAGSNFVPSAQLACYFGDEQVRALSPTLTLALTLSLSLSLSPNPG